MIKNIYFVRYSKRDFSIKEDKIAPLTVEGIDLAEKLKSYFINKDIAVIYTSPYPRAIQTIMPTVNLLGLKLILKEDLHERAVGEWVNNFSEFSLKQWNNFNFKLRTGESLDEVQQRMVIIYNKILNQEKSNIIISGHGTSLAVLFNYILNGDFGFKQFKEMKMPDLYCAKYENNSLIEFKRCKFT